MILPATLDQHGPLNDTMGALYIGTLASAIIYGFCLLQASRYFRKFGDDPWYIKTAVITLLTFDTIQLFLIVTGVYYYVIWNYFNPSKLQYLAWPILIEALFVVANGAIVQIFYIFRVCRLSHNKLFCSFILFLVICEIGVGVSWVALSMKMKTYYDLLKLSPLAITIHVFACSIDILIAGSLCFLLHRARTGFERTDSIINKLILFVISTGLLTTMLALLALITLLSCPFSLIYVALYFCLGRLYTNSFLTTLNARSTLVDENEFKKCTTTRQGTRESYCKPRNVNIRVDTFVTQEGTNGDKEKTLCVTDSVPTKGGVESNGDLLEESYSEKGQP